VIAANKGALLVSMFCLGILLGDEFLSYCASRSTIFNAMWPQLLNLTRNR